MRLVIDASAALMWELAEPDSARTLRLREGYRAGIHELLAPDIFPAEIGNGLLVAERHGRIAPGRFAPALAAILADCPALHETRPLVPDLLAIIAAVTTGFRLSFYDALYVALAARESCPLVTGDGKLVRNLQAQYPFIIPVTALP